MIHAFGASRRDVLSILRCKDEDCATEILLPYSVPLRTVHNPHRSAKGDPYLDVACPRCGQAFRYAQPHSRRVYTDTGSCRRFPSGSAWFGVWLKCDKKMCASHVLVESVAPGSALSKISYEHVQALVAGWQVADDVRCFLDHRVRSPVRIIWDSITDIIRTA